MDIWPYSTFTYQVTPEMIGGMSDSCQWFNAQFDPLMGQIDAFNRNLADHRDVYASVQSQADAVVADIDRSTGFLGPRLQPLTIRNTPDNFGPYSPIYGGEQLTGVLFQLSRIADSMRKNSRPASRVHTSTPRSDGPTPCGIPRPAPKRRSSKNPQARGWGRFGGAAADRPPAADQR